MTTDTSPAAVEALCERLTAMKDSGLRTIGGGSITAAGKCEMWGNEPIMVQTNPDGLEAAVLIRALAARNARLEEERDAAMKECVDWARQAGEAKGRLEGSEMAGVVDGWRERALAAEAALSEKE